MRLGGVRASVNRRCVSRSAGVYCSEECDFAQNREGREFEALKQLEHASCARGQVEWFGELAMRTGSHYFLKILQR